MVYIYFLMIFTATISSSIFCDAQVKLFYAGSTETIFRISTNCSYWELWQSLLQIVLEALFIFNTIYVHWICFQTCGSLFFYSRQQKHTEEALWIQVTGDAFQQKTNKHMTPVPYNKLLTNLASSSRTGEYWTSVVLPRPRPRSATTSGQYSPVRPSRSVSKRLLLYGFEL